MDTNERSQLLQRFREGTSVFIDFSLSLDRSQLDHSDSGGGWSPRQVIHHMADGELVAALRLRNLLARQPEVPRQDEDALATHLGYATRPIDASLALIRAVRDGSAEILAGLDDAEWQIGFTNSAGRTMTPESWLQVYANHPFNHVDQMRATLGQA